MTPLRILLVGGGSLGHIAPAVAVARALQAKNPDAQLHMICTNRPEEGTFLQKEHIPFTALPLLRRSYTLPFRFARARKTAERILETFQPHCVFCKGGAVSVPVALEAHRRNIPIVLHESDVSPGWANRLVARWANVVCCGFPQTYIRAQQLVHTGNPVRPEMTRGERAEGLRITGFAGTRPVLLAIGGSQGAESLNRIVTSLLPSLLPLCDVAHVTGEGKTAATPQPGYWSAPLLHEQYAHLFAIATIGLSRSGAGSISELAANGIPSILVPLTGVARDHQRLNANAATEEGGCIVVTQEQLKERLIPLMQELLRDSARRKKMSEKMRAFSSPGAAESIARIVQSSAEQML